MALSSSEKKEIENIVRKEIKSFMGNTTMKQFEDKFMDKIQKEMKRGRLEGEIKDITQRMFREFYQFMWNSRNQWEQKLKNA
jgi:Ni,Fe-hydrogenase III component G